MKNAKQERLKAQSEFLANANHEIRTPLGVMLGFAELLRDPSLSADERESLIKKILKHGHRLVHVLDELIEQTHQEGLAFQVPPHIEPLSATVFMGQPLDERPLLGVSVLTVDDVPDNQFLIKQFLESAGARVEVASNGAEAIAKALSDDPDLVLMDIQMPGINGYQATRELRARGYNRPIVALTANGPGEAREKCLSSGCTDYMSKPIDSTSLLAKVHLASRLKNKSPDMKSGL